MNTVGGISLFTDIPIESPGSPVTAAYLNAGAVPEGELRNALTEALEVLYERSDYEEMQADAEQNRETIREMQDQIEDVERERDEARARLEEHLQKDDKASEIEALKTKLDEAIGASASICTRLRLASSATHRRRRLLARRGRTPRRRADRSAQAGRRAGGPERPDQERSRPGGRRALLEREGTCDGRRQVRPLLQAREGRYYSNAWVVDGYGDRDWIAVLWRDRGGNFCASLRIRIVQESRIEDDLFEFPGMTEAQAIAEVNKVAAQVLSQDLGTYVAKMPVRTMQARMLQAAFDLRLNRWPTYYGRA